jgi:hypothetical protein
LCSYGTWSLNLREEQILMVFENRKLSRIFEFEKRCQEAVGK